MATGGKRRADSRGRREVRHKQPCGGSKIPE